MWLLTMGAKKKNKQKKKKEMNDKNGANFKFFQSYFNNHKCNHAMIGYAVFR